MNSKVEEIANEPKYRKCCEAGTNYLKAGSWKSKDKDKTDDNINQEKNLQAKVCVLHNWLFSSKLNEIQLFRLSWVTYILYIAYLSFCILYFKF